MRFSSNSLSLHDGYNLRYVSAPNQFSRWDRISRYVLLVWRLRIGVLVTSHGLFPQNT